MDTISQATSFFENLKILIESAIASLPTEITALITTALILIVVFFIYKFVR